MIRRRQLTATKGNDGRLLVAVPFELVKAAVEAGAQPPHLGVDEAVIDQLRIELAEALAEAEHWRSQAHTMELAATRAEVEIKAKEALDRRPRCAL